MNWRCSYSSSHQNPQLFQICSSSVTPSPYPLTSEFHSQPVPTTTRRHSQPNTTAAPIPQHHLCYRPSAGKDFRSRV
ncbi:hypothetical protein Hanom_Chr02g00127891 [Helianthus anomalus]